MTAPVRKPYVAGTFYPAEVDTLRKFLSHHLGTIHAAQDAKAVILPHAGYIYSARTACEALRKVTIPETCFLIGPNHFGIGHPFALIPEGSWETPLGSVPIDRDFAAGLLEASHDLSPDFMAHEREHSLEVEVPLLQHRNPHVRIVPLLIGTLNLGWVREVADSLAEFLKTRSRFLIVASSDMSHYESDEATREKDQYALQAIEKLDEVRLAHAVERYKITMCGFVPVYMALILAKALGAKKGTLIDYRTSADASGDYDRVVGYASFVIE